MKANNPPIRRRRPPVPVALRCESLVHTELKVDFDQCMYAGKGFRDDLRGRPRRACTIHLHKDMNGPWVRYEDVPH
jgi:hypothetical protein